MEDLLHTLISMGSVCCMFITCSPPWGHDACVRVGHEVIGERAGNVASDIASFCTVDWIAAEAEPAVLASDHGQRDDSIADREILDAWTQLGDGAYKFMAKDLPRSERFERM